MKQTLMLLAVTIALTACGDDTYNYQFPEEEAPVVPVVDKPTPAKPTPTPPATPTPTPSCEKDHKCEDDDAEKNRKP